MNAWAPEQAIFCTECNLSLAGLGPGIRYYSAPWLDRSPEVTKENFKIFLAFFLIRVHSLFDYIFRIDFDAYPVFEIDFSFYEDIILPLYPKNEGLFMYSENVKNEIEDWIRKISKKNEPEFFSKSQKFKKIS